MSSCRVNSCDCLSCAADEECNNTHPCCSKYKGGRNAFRVNIRLSSFMLLLSASLFCLLTAFVSPLTMWCRYVSVAPMGPVGYLTTCGYLYNHLYDHGALSANEIADYHCNGHADPECRYQYRSAPTCVEEFPDNDEGAVVGYLFDGYEVRSYSQCGDAASGFRRCKSCLKRRAGSSGEHTDDYDYEPDNECDLDEANGMVVEESGGFKYVYVITDNYPFIFPGFRGATWAPLVEYSGGYTNGPNKGKASQCGNLSDCVCFSVSHCLCLWHTRSLRATQSDGSATDECACRGQRGGAN